MTVKIEELEENEEGDEDGTKDETHTENNQDGSESSSESDSTDGKGTDAEGDRPDGDREEADGSSSEQEETETVEEPDPRDAEIADLKVKLSDIAKQVEQNKQRPEDAQPRQRSDQEWKEIETKAQLPREAISWFEGELREGLTALGKLLLGRMDQSMSGSIRDKTIEKLSQVKEFASIKQYSKDMDEFLKRFDPSTHGNEDLIKSAFFYARGLNSGKAVKRAMNSTEKNRRVAGAGRPASPSGKSDSTSSRPGGKKIDLRLTATEKDTYNSFGKYTFKSEEEYARSLPRNKAA